MFMARHGGLEFGKAGKAWMAASSPDMTRLELEGA
jgi:hypothetical protein